MKKIAITLYVISILLISGFARAEAATLATYSQVQYQSPVKLNQAVSEGLTVRIAGTLPCPSGQPMAILTQDSQSPSTLTLRLSSPLPLDACIARVVGFNAQIELPLLTQTSMIKIDENIIYLIKVEGLDFSTQVRGSDLLK